MKLTKKHWIMIGGAAALLTTGAVLYARHRKKLKAQESKKKGFTDKIQAEEAKIVQEEHVEEESEKMTEIINQELETDDVVMFPLKNGSEGYPVAVIQKYMNSTCKASLETIDAYPLEVNGVFDKEMEEACKICSSVKRSEIEEDYFNRVFNDMKAANILPEIE